VSGPKKIKAGVDAAKRSAQEIEDGNNSDREGKGSQAISNGDNARFVCDEKAQNAFHRIRSSLTMKPRPAIALESSRWQIAPDLTHPLKFLLHFV
jgi:hypothetical protein